MFAWAFENTEVSGTYELIDKPPGEVAEFLRRDAVNWDGLNVTVPHKSIAYQACESYSLRAQACQAANVLSFRDGKLHGDNTDADGFLLALDRAAAGRVFNNAVVIGAGGAARAVIGALLSSQRSHSVSVALRNTNSDAALICQRKFPDAVYVSIDQAAGELSRSDLVVQASPLGSVSSPGCPIPRTAEFMSDSVVVDLIYNPEKTELLRLAERRSAKIQNGLTMLIAQAGLAFDLWTGMRFPFDVAFEELPNYLKNS